MMRLGEGQWAVRWRGGDVRQLAALSDWGGIHVAVPEDSSMADELWLKGDFTSLGEGSAGQQPSQQLSQQLLSLVNAELYHVMDDEQLVPYGKRVPVGWLPAIAWQSLRDLLQFQMPVAQLAGGSVRPMGLTLVRGSSRFHHVGVTPELLITEIDALLRWVNNAPSSSFARLEFACDAPRRVAIRGAALPPIAGVRYSVFDSVAVPVGWHWQPAVTPQTVNQVFALGEQALAIWFEDNTWQEVPRSKFLPVRRGSVRLTAARLTLG